MQLPEKVELAFLPTPIYKLEKVSKQFQKNIYIKRDDLTGIETSGNKIRKLEYSLREAFEQGCDLVITCGGMQSNHARATAYAAAKLSMKSCLLLRGNGSSEPVEGNYFLDRLVGADIVIKEPEIFNHDKDKIMLKLKTAYEAKGYKPYIIPMGASNGIGTLGYVEAFTEILKQEEAMKVEFDTIINAVGSGGTYAGLYIGNELNRTKKQIIGFNVCDDKEYFIKEITKIIKEAQVYFDQEIKTERIKIIDGYVGQGYALSRSEELDAIASLAKLEAVVLDPVYTGKAYYGLINELEKGTFVDSENILFMHTGGIFGLFPKQSQFK